MIKVVRAGVDKADVPVRETCPHCTCIFDFTRDEARAEPDLDETEALVIGCPSCGTELWVRPNLPARFK